MNVADHPLETKKFLAYIPEQITLYRHLTGVENLEYFTSFAGQKYGRAELCTFVREAGLADSAAARRVSTYSKGMRQRIGIAIAIAKNANTLLPDEPASGVDPSAANESRNS